MILPLGTKLLCIRQWPRYTPLERTATPPEVWTVCDVGARSAMIYNGCRSFRVPWAVIRLHFEVLSDTP